MSPSVSPSASASPSVSPSISPSASASPSPPPWGGGGGFGVGYMDGRLALLDWQWRMFLPDVRGQAEWYGAAPWMDVDGDVINPVAGVAGASAAGPSFRITGSVNETVVLDDEDLAIFGMI